MNQGTRQRPAAGRLRRRAAPRRAELAAIRVEHLEARERGLRLTLARYKGERAGRSVTVAIPFGTTLLCPVRALRR